MEILLSRHGNTFELNEPATWVGCMNDLPLVKAGIEQARVLANALNQSKRTLNAIYCASLQRTRMYAEVIIDETQSNLEPIVDSRLNELDYGGWSGLTSQEISKKFGVEALEGWEKYSKWPVGAHWGSSEQEVSREVLSFAADLIEKHPVGDVVLVVSSNGRLRYFLNLIPGEFEKKASSGTLKTKTGHVSSLSCVDKKWHLHYWNRCPVEALLAKNVY